MSAKPIQLLPLASLGKFPTKGLFSSEAQLAAVKFF